MGLPVAIARGQLAVLGAQHVREALCVTSLFRKARRHTETDTYIADRLVAAIDILKGCQTEQQRRNFRLALALVAPTRVASGDHEGMARRVSARLHVQRGKRSKKRVSGPTHSKQPRRAAPTLTSRRLGSTLLLGRSVRGSSTLS